MSSVDHNKPIRFGLFDSGVGGLSVLQRLHDLALDCGNRRFEFVYLGDTARCPYGNREPSEIKEFIGQIVTFLSQHGVDHLIMACNTSAAVGLGHARQVSPVPVHDLITPAARFAAASFRRVGVMATHSTVQSRAFSSCIQYHAPECRVTEVACPKLVPLVEAGDLYSDQVKAALMEYVSRLEAEEVEAIVLGCTHFPFLTRALRDLLPPETALIDPAELLYDQLMLDLELKSDTTKSLSEDNHSSQFFTTGAVDAFIKGASVCLGAESLTLVPPSRVQKLPLETLRSMFVSAEDRVTNLPSNVVPFKSGGDSKIVAP